MGCGDASGYRHDELAERADDAVHNDEAQRDAGRHVNDGQQGVYDIICIAEDLIDVNGKCHGVHLLLV